jgi:adenylosuccinate synthase
MNNKINFVDICCGLNWGDEAKGKIIAQLAKSGHYNFVCRWAGGNNAGHTVYVNNKKYKTHLIPCGIFYNIPSIIGPDCVVHMSSFQNEILYLKQNGFNTELIKISPKAHLVTDNHINEDVKDYKSQGTTSKGIAPCYRDKYARVGTQIKDVDYFKPYIWDEALYGNVLCEGAQGFWLDINQGNYPYVTSSTTLPYGACSLGFSPKLIRHIYGASKIYDTRSGTDPHFPESLLDNSELMSVVQQGNEFGATTGRMRKVNWLNINKLVKAINTTGTTIVIISKIDVLEELSNYKLIENNTILSFNSIQEMKDHINDTLHSQCSSVYKILYSNNVEFVDNL